MSKKNEGPFKRKKTKSHKDLSIHAPWVGAAVAIIALAQVPIALKSTIEIICLSEQNNKDSLNISWCKELYKEVN